MTHNTEQPTLDTEGESDKCICPVAIITVTNGEHVSRAQMKEVADMLNASVSLDDGTGGRSIVYGLHRQECPCAPFTSKGRW